VTDPHPAPHLAAPVAPDEETPAVPVEDRRRSLVTLVVVAVGVVVLDRLSKFWVVSTIQPRIDSGEGPYVFLGGLLKLTYTQNTGAAFSIGTGYTWIFSIIAVVVAVVIVRSARRLGSRWWAVALGGLLGGLLGNLIDRMTRPPSPGLGYVVDWIQLPHFAVFNVADMAIVGSAALMVLLALRGVEFSGRGAAATT
jgi:signal peptidase II